MAVVSREWFATAFRDATDDTRVAFVADLYAARGYTVHRETDDVLRLEPGDRRVTIAHPDSTTVPDSADTVVTLDQASRDAVETRIVTVADLHEALVFAVDTDVTESLLEAHFDYDPDAHTPAVVEDRETKAGPQTTDSHQSGGDTDGSNDASETAGSVRKGGSSMRATALLRRVSRRGNRHLVVVLVAVVLVLAGGAGLAGVFAGIGDETTETTPQDRLTPVNGTALAVAHHTGESESTEPMPTETPTTSVDSLAEHSIVAEQRASEPYPPGLNPWGIDSARRMAAAHRTELRETSYTIRVRYQEFVDGRPTGIYTETVRVENASRYSVSVETVGDLRTTPRTIAGTDAFRNESGLTLRDEPANSDVRIDVTATQFLERAEQYLHWSLSVENSTVRDQRTVSNRTTYLVTTDEDPYTGVENASGTAYVTESGLVTYGRWSYEVPRQPDLRIVFTIETTDVGSTTVSPPGWVNVTD